MIQFIINMVRQLLKKYKRKEFLIGISSGHSKNDMGAFCSITNQNEYSYVGDLSTKLVELLRTMGYGVYSPDSISDELSYPEHLRRSVDLLNLHEVDVSIEIHLNKFSDERVSGTETLSNSIGLGLATSVQVELVKEFKLRDRGIKQPKGKYFLNKIEGPSIIIEPLFLSNGNDVAVLKDPGFNNAFCVSIVSALDNYFGIT